MILLECNVSLAKQLKGGKKVKKLSRPYFETKVVKVKKGKCKHNIIKWYDDKTVRCYLCGEIFMHNVEHKHFFPFVGTKKISIEKSNWVNGENLDKIKFPVPCSYIYFGTKRYAMLSKGATFNGPTKYHYSLIDIRKQNEHLSEDFLEYDLREMIKNHDIHILKGKIILFEEE